MAGLRSTNLPSGPLGGAPGATMGHGKRSLGCPFGAFEPAPPAPREHLVGEPGVGVMLFDAQLRFVKDSRTKKNQSPARTEQEHRPRYREARSALVAVIDDPPMPHCALPLALIDHLRVSLFDERKSNRKGKIRWSRRIYRERPNPIILDPSRRVTFGSKNEGTPYTGATSSTHSCNCANTLAIGCAASCS